MYTGRLSIILSLISFTALVGSTFERYFLQISEFIYNENFVGFLRVQNNTFAAPPRDSAWVRRAPAKRRHRKTSSFVLDHRTKIKLFDPIRSCLVNHITGTVKIKTVSAVGMLQYEFRRAKRS